MSTDSSTGSKFSPHLIVVPCIACAVLGILIGFGASKAAGSFFSGAGIIGQSASAQRVEATDQRAIDNDSVAFNRLCRTFNLDSNGRIRSSN
jgi:hypothetical protein